MRRIDLVGKRFGRWTVLEMERDRRDGLGIMWLCRCDCGTTRHVSGRHMRRGASVSCGCLKAERQALRNRTHGMFGVPEYHSWSGMIQRCTNPGNPSYANYGGRGITVCERWRSFKDFLLDMGRRPKGTSIDRIDNDGSYEPGNCRWATRTVQNSNKRRASTSRPSPSDPTPLVSPSPRPA
jgi:hypothetical protein